MKKLTKAKINTKIIIMVMIIMFFYMAISTGKEVYSAYHQGLENIAVFETNMLNREKQRLYNLSEMMTGYILSYPATKNNRTKLLSQIKGHVKQMRFDKDKSGYFFIIDNTRPYPLNLVHPSPKIEGKIMNQPLFNNRVIDNLGGPDKNLMKAFFEICDKSKDKEGFVKYLWPKPGEEKDQPKLAFVRYISEYDFYIGTGFYIDDIYKSIDKMKNEIRDQIYSVIVYNLIVGLVIFLLASAIVFYGTKKILNIPLDNLLFGLKKVHNGDKEVSIKIIYDDELGYVSRSFNDMVSTIRESEAKLQEYAENLENKVKKRTINLTKTLEHIQKLKSQQDGDYFLTSLILKPLGPNRAESKNIKIDFIVEQKKKFKFRKWENDIGGDICITDNIELNNKKFTVFVNGDAMGKSLQGAGGAMVLGAAFQSILERSRFASDVKKQSPERWLKNAFTEMHAIFESFDGSMLMSAVIGLIDETSGLMYFINAEHPFVVLFRDGKASFIENDSIFRKLGSPIIHGKIFVQTFQMKNNDILFIGSDGRDDLLMGNVENGERIINEDETVFLRSIEKAEGRLDDTVDEIKKIGDLTDDLSVMRIEYQNKDKFKMDVMLKDYLSRAKSARRDKKIDNAITILKNAEEKQKLHPRLTKELFKSYLAAGKYKEAVSTGFIYCSQNPSDTSSLFALSYALKKNKECNKAIDTGERVRLREPRHINNLINLAECYTILRFYNRAQKIAAEVIEIQPESIKIQKIMNLIEKKMAELSD